MRIGEFLAVEAILLNVNIFGGVFTRCRTSRSDMEVFAWIVLLVETDGNPIEQATSQREGRIDVVQTCHTEQAYAGDNIPGT